MNKAKKMTEGHSSGPQAYWDAKQAESDVAVSEIERLRDLVDAGKDDRKSIDELVDENKRLLELLKDCRPYIAGWTEARELWDRIKKEVSGE